MSMEEASSFETPNEIQQFWGGSGGLGNRLWLKCKPGLADYDV